MAKAVHMTFVLIAFSVLSYLMLIQIQTSQSKSLVVSESPSLKYNCKLPNFGVAVIRSWSDEKMKKILKQSIAACLKLDND